MVDLRFEPMQSGSTSLLLRSLCPTVTFDLFLAWNQKLIQGYPDSVWMAIGEKQRKGIVLLPSRILRLVKAEISQGESKGLMD